MREITHRAGASGLLTSLSIAIIGLYRQWISPMLPPTCRFQPTCSEYARGAILKHGFIRGLRLTGRRLLRCHPWGGSGYDPIP